MRPAPVLPDGWPRPKGYSNGVVGSGRILHLAGMVGWDLEERFPDGFVPQFERALESFLAVVEKAGGSSSDVVSMTIFVTDMNAYRESLAPLGACWRRLMGRTYPAMAVVGVTELVEPEARVEIQGVALLEEEA